MRCVDSYQSCDHFIKDGIIYRAPFVRKSRNAVSAYIYLMDEVNELLDNISIARDLIAHGLMDGDVYYDLFGFDSYYIIRHGRRFGSSEFNTRRACGKIINARSNTWIPFNGYGGSVKYNNKSGYGKFIKRRTNKRFRQMNKLNIMKNCGQAPAPNIKATHLYHWYY